jgi:asparagine synthase (glutamine-hydrolysing)
VCGICGSFGFAERKMLQSLCESMKHRGPDGTDLFVDQNAGLGAVRLAMVDIEGNRQPAHNEDGTIWAVFNGEIYDFRRWIPRLEQLGHRFYSHGDAETIVHLYEEYGPEFVHRLRGMFAVALWDGRIRRGLLVRDRFGVKPLYYTEGREGILFASELRSLVPYVSREVDMGLVAYYLQLRYFPADRSPLKAVRKVPPGHLLAFGSEGATISRYWSVDDLTPIPRFEPDPDALRRLLLESIELRLVSDVPLGVFLSGGLDSSLIVAGMHQLKVPEIATFSIGFGDLYDEAPAAREVAELFGTKHMEIQLPEPSLMELLPRVMSTLDEPIADPAAVPTYALAAAARRSVKGVLLGEGADEVFGGYEQYRLLSALSDSSYGAVLRRAARLPNSLLGVAVNRVSPLGRNMGPDGSMRVRAALAASDASQSYLCLVEVFASDELPEKVSEASSLSASKQLASYFRGSDPVRDAQRFDLENHLVHLLDRTDRMTMANSIEGREPFLDPSLVRFSLASSSKSRVTVLQDKAVLRSAAVDLLPRAMRKRRKRRFFVPIDAWFASELGSYFEEVMEEPSLTLVDRTELARLKQRFSRSPLRAARQMWALLCLQLWYRAIVDIGSAS